MRSVVMIAHNLRSTHNVGSLLRTADGLGIDMVYLTGFTPYPAHSKDQRLPHESAKLSRQINKTALGAEDTQPWQHNGEISELIARLKQDGFAICALEQVPGAMPLHEYTAGSKTAIIVGNEVNGLEQSVLDLCDMHLVIPMQGKKESFNVVQAAAMCLYQISVKR